MARKHKRDKAFSCYRTLRAHNGERSTPMASSRTQMLPEWAKPVPDVDDWDEIGEVRMPHYGNVCTIVMLGDVALCRARRV
jgi:hypothetical protein